MSPVKFPISVPPQCKLPLGTVPIISTFGLWNQQVVPKLLERKLQVHLHEYAEHFDVIFSHLYRNESNYSNKIR